VFFFFFFKELEMFTAQKQSPPFGEQRRMVNEINVKTQAASSGACTRQKNDFFFFLERA